MVEYAIKKKISDLCLRLGSEYLSASLVIAQWTGSVGTDIPIPTATQLWQILLIIQKKSSSYT
jgi:hypothetical protein